ncbi:hypothetical protein [Terriglobus roseus]|uniref:hypothetical protein n=1 Tax=Terriglobus roseus TaxID=392734 RepID=UPI001560FCB8|nr:hypothetical protein [Terriglobus roseus]
MLSSIALVVPILLTANAQEKRPTESRVQTTSGWELQVTNSTAIPLEAYRVRIECPPVASGHPQVFEKNQDALMNFNPDVVVDPGKAQSIKIPDAVSQCEGGIIGAIFADGSTFGTPDGIAYLYAMRQGLRDGLLFAQPLLGRISSGQLEPQDAAKLLDEKRDQIQSDRSLSVPQWMGEAHALTIVAVLLNEQVDLRVPSDRTPQHQPIIQEYADKAKVTTKRAHSVVISRKLAEWLTALSESAQPSQ